MAGRAVLRDVRRGTHGALVRDEVAGVIGLARGDRDPMGTRDLLNHHPRRIAFVMPIGRRYARIDDVNRAGNLGGRLV